jgi:hypothetical protein
MSMFDTIKCLYPLPDTDAEMQVSDFQTKHLENCMDNYTITEEGRLILHQVEYNIVPEEERPYYGKPEWDKNPFFQVIGSLKNIPVGDKDTNYHGMIIMYSCRGSRERNNLEWFEYELEFTKGLITNVKRLYKEYGGSNG